MLMRRSTVPISFLDALKVCAMSCFRIRASKAGALKTPSASVVSCVGALWPWRCAFASTAAIAVVASACVRMSSAKA